MGGRIGRATALGQDWLVKTIGGLIAIIGGALLVAGSRREVPRETALLGAASAAALAWSDVYHMARPRISKAYLLDAVAEAPFLAGWVALALGRRRGAQRPSPREA